MKNILFIIIFIGLLSACGGHTILPPPDICDSSSEPPPNKLTYRGSPEFDDELTRTLCHHDGSVFVSLGKALDYEAGQMHPPLVKWFDLVDASGGKIEREDYATLDSGVITIILVGIYAAYEAIRAEMRKSQKKEKIAKQRELAALYDVRLCSFAGSNDDYTVNQVVFVYKGEKTRVCV